RRRKGSAVFTLSNERLSGATTQQRRSHHSRLSQLDGAGASGSDYYSYVASFSPAAAAASRLGLLRQRLIARIGDLTLRQVHICCCLAILLALDALAKLLNLTVTAVAGRLLANLMASGLFCCLWSGVVQLLGRSQQGAAVGCLLANPPAWAPTPVRFWEAELAIAAAERKPEPPAAQQRRNRGGTAGSGTASHGRLRSWLQV
uniref:Pecanex-like protein n=1 Tax=Macrostomum lignano TaxID=282301 RepID=A0A1I8F161_9PLAT